MESMFATAAQWSYVVRVLQEGVHANAAFNHLIILEQLLIEQNGGHCLDDIVVEQSPSLSLLHFLAYLYQIYWHHEENGVQRAQHEHVKDAHQQQV